MIIETILDLIEVDSHADVLIFSISIFLSLLGQLLGRIVIPIAPNLNEKKIQIRSAKFITLIAQELRHSNKDSLSRVQLQSQKKK
jgi:hypothetical protein